MSKGARRGGRERSYVHLGGGDVKVKAEVVLDFPRGFAVIADALVHDPFQQLPVLVVFARGGVREAKDQCYYPRGQSRIYRGDNGIVSPYGFHR